MIPFLDAEKMGDEAMGIALAVCRIIEGHDITATASALSNILEWLGEERGPAYQYAIANQLTRSAERLRDGLPPPSNKEDTPNGRE